MRCGHDGLRSPTSTGVLPQDLERRTRPCAGDGREGVSGAIGSSGFESCSFSMLLNGSGGDPFALFLLQGRRPIFTVRLIVAGRAARRRQSSGQPAQRAVRWGLPSWPGSRNPGPTPKAPLRRRRRSSRRAPSARAVAASTSMRTAGSSPAWHRASTTRFPRDGSVRAAGPRTRRPPGVNDSRSPSCGGAAPSSRPSGRRR